MSVEEIIHAAKRKAEAERAQQQPRSNVYHKYVRFSSGKTALQVYWRSAGRLDALIYESDWFGGTPPYNEILRDVYSQFDYILPNGDRPFGFVLPLCIPRELVIFWWMVTDIEMPHWFCYEDININPAFSWAKIPKESFDAWLKLLRFTGYVPKTKIPWESEEARAKSKLRRF